jgi:hypothetical protein
MRPDDGPGARGTTLYFLQDMPMLQNPDRTGIPKVGAIGGLLAAALFAGKWFKPIVQSHLIPTQTTPTGRAQQFSDARLKRNVVRVGKLDNRVVLYRFNYLNSSDVYVGVIAQEVLAVVPEAVIIGEDGFMRVNYERLGTRMMTWEEWQKQRERRFRLVK